MKQDATWFEIDPETLSEGCKGYYAKYKALYREAKAAREEFERGIEFEAKLDAGKRMIFGYNFGKLSVAVVEDDRKQAKAKPGKATLADFLALQGQSGRRV